MDDVFANSLLKETITQANPIETIFAKWHEFSLQTLAVDHTPKFSSTGVSLHLKEFGPCRASYAMAMVHLAMYEVANAYKGPPTQQNSWIERYQPGAIGAAPAGFEAAAISAAASRMLEHLYSANDDDYGIGTEYRKVLQELHLSPGNAGETFGYKVANLIIQLRSDDASNVPEPMWDVQFEPNTMDSSWHWEIDPVSANKVALGAYWGNVRPFLLTKTPRSYVNDTQHFPPPPPGDLNNAEFKRAFDEVKDCGVDSHALNEIRDCHVNGLNSEDTYYRGKFWSYDGTAGVCAPVRLYNRIADTILAKRQSEIAHGERSDVDLTVRDARYYATLNLTMADAAIVAWDAKYYYQYWRPITGVRHILLNMPSIPVTPPLHNKREAWLALGAQNTNAAQGFNVTPPFPSYPSGHSVFGGAFFEVLRSFVKTDQTFTFQSDEYNPARVTVKNVDAFNYVRCVDDPHASGDLVTYCRAREFNFKKANPTDFDPTSAGFDPNNAEVENSNSRIWLGVHWRFDGDNGIILGRQVGDDALTKAFE
jgi:hypothetical protein